jgi:hypothetical protein
LLADRASAPASYSNKALLMTKDAIIAISVFFAIMILLAITAWIGYPNWTTQ